MSGCRYGPDAELFKLETIGTHYIVEMYGCPYYLLDNEEFVCNAMREAVRCCGAELMGDISHHFHPQGVTSLGILAESHISVHTWPEHGYVAADIFTCGTRADPHKACVYLVDVFQAGRYIINKLTRGKESEKRMIASSTVMSAT